MQSSVVNVLQFSIDSLSLRQQAIANNIANYATPGYTATGVSFQRSLTQALSSPGSTATATATEMASNAPPASDGNNVNLSAELIAAEKVTLQYQTMVNALNAQIRLVRGSLGGSFT
jgi:flagellar basal-body rod protein FlgB